MRERERERRGNRRESMMIIMRGKDGGGASVKALKRKRTGTGQAPRVGTPVHRRPANTAGKH